MGVGVRRWHHLHPELREHRGLLLAQNLGQTLTKVDEIEYSLGPIMNTAAFLKHVIIIIIIVIIYYCYAWIIMDVCEAVNMDNLCVSRIK